MTHFLKTLLLASPLLVAISVLPVAAYDAPKVEVPPIIDGNMDDVAWQQASWQPINHLILGKTDGPADFSGRYKIVWTTDRLYVLAMITDDVLLDRTANPLERYWEDDIFEILVDEDASGGDHHHSYNAFAYHISLDDQAVDIDESGNPRLLNDHIESHWQRSIEHDSAVLWEISVQIYDDSFSDKTTDAKPIALSANKTMGFMIAYCDADDPDNGREAFITSHDIAPVNGDKNRAYLDASVFGKLVLVDQ
ncbi:MAG: sugar-binding protein [Pseudomonadota bacterium]